MLSEWLFGVSERVFVLSDITFAVSENGTTRATNLKDGAKTRLLKGKVFYIESVAGTDQPFLIEVYAHIVRWPKG